MGFAFSHLILAWLAGKGYEYFRQRKISHRAWFFLLLGGILPDADFLLDWTVGTEIHRTFTHSLLFVVIAPLLVYIIFWIGKNSEGVLLAYALGAGIFSHLVLDMFLSQGVPLLWPNLLHFSWTQVGYFDPATPSFLNSSPEVLRRALKIAIVDMALGTAWILYLWWKRKVEF